jgi:1,4-dihydroxy-2-naphthoate octaprenyltransferase
MTEATLSPLSRLKEYFEALRPKTLTAALVPVMVGTAIAPQSLLDIHQFLFLSVLSSALLIQIGTNLVNDACDFVKGADTEERLGPKRLIQKGMATPKGLLMAGTIAFALAALFSIPLVTVGGPFFAVLIAISILSGYLYTAGPFPIAYVGLGEIFVLAFFGPILTGSAYFFQTGYVSLEAFLAGLQVGLLATALIAINNLRDRDQDKKAGKKTLAVRFGVAFTKMLISIVILTPFALSLYWLKVNFFGCLFPFFTLPMALNLVRGIWRSEPGHVYNRFLQEAAILHLCFGSLLAIGANVR